MTTAARRRLVQRAAGSRNRGPVRGGTDADYWWPQGQAECPPGHVSQDSDRKVRDVAATLVERTQRGTSSAVVGSER